MGCHTDYYKREFLLFCIGKQCVQNIAYKSFLKIDNEGMFDKTNRSQVISID